MAENLLFYGDNLPILRDYIRDETHHNRSMAMRTDLYTKAVLSLIALSLFVLAFREVFTPSIASARGSVSCDGELKANAWGGAEPSIGGYKIEVNCR